MTQRYTLQVFLKTNPVVCLGGTIPLGVTLDAVNKAILDMVAKREQMGNASFIQQFNTEEGPFQFDVKLYAGSHISKIPPQNQSATNAIKDPFAS